MNIFDNKSKNHCGRTKNSFTKNHIKIYTLPIIVLNFPEVQLQNNLFSFISLDFNIEENINQTKKLLEMGLISLISLIEECREPL